MCYRQQYVWFGTEKSEVLDGNGDLTILDEEIALALYTDIAHMLITGTIGSGKTVLIDPKRHNFMRL